MEALCSDRHLTHPTFCATTLSPRPSFGGGTRSGPQRSGARTHQQQRGRCSMAPMHRGRRAHPVLPRKEHGGQSGHGHGLLRQPPGPARVEGGRPHPLTPSPGRRGGGKLNLGVTPRPPAGLRPCTLPVVEAARLLVIPCATRSLPPAGPRAMNGDGRLAATCPARARRARPRSATR